MQGVSRHSSTRFGILANEGVSFHKVTDIFQIITSIEEVDDDTFEFSSD